MPTFLSSKNNQNTSTKVAKYKKKKTYIYKLFVQLTFMSENFERLCIYIQNQIKLILFYLILMYIDKNKPWKFCEFSINRYGIDIIYKYDDARKLIDYQ